MTGTETLPARDLQGPHRRVPAGAVACRDADRRPCRRRRPGVDPGHEQRHQPRDRRAGDGDVDARAAHRGRSHRRALGGDAARRRLGRRDAVGRHGVSSGQLDGAASSRRRRRPPPAEQGTDRRPRPGPSRRARPRSDQASASAPTGKAASPKPLKPSTTMLCSRPWYSTSDSDSISDIVVVWKTSPCAPTRTQDEQGQPERRGPGRGRRRPPKRDARQGDHAPRPPCHPRRARGDEAGDDRAEPGDPGHHPVAAGADLVALVGQRGQEREVREADDDDADRRQRDEAETVGRGGRRGRRRPSRPAASASERRRGRPGGRPRSTSRRAGSSPRRAGTRHRCPTS